MRAVDRISARPLTDRRRTPPTANGPMSFVQGDRRSELSRRDGSG